MEEKNTGKRREWVKNAAIIFLTIMLILTFFSNTIMNYSLPEVATQQVQRGTITAKIRGTGNVEATDPYNVVAKESRVISSVAVKQGDTVEKDQIIYYLEDAESDELTKAQKELEDLELAYMKGLFGANVSSEVISKVANGNIDNFSQLQAKVTDMQNRIVAAEARVKECQDNLNQITLNSTKSTNDASVNTIPYEQEVTIQQNAEIKSEKEFKDWQTQELARLDKEIAEKKKAISDLKLLIDNAQDLTSETPLATETEVKRREAELTKKINALPTVGDPPNKPKITSTDEEDKTYYTKMWEKAKDDIEKAEYQKLYDEYRVAKDSYKEALRILGEYGGTGGESKNDRIAELENLKKVLSEREIKRASIAAETYSAGNGVQDAKARLDEVTNTNKQTAASYQNQIASADAALKNAQAVLELLKTEQTKLTADINAELDLAKASKDIANKEEEIAKLKEKSMGGSVKAPVAGTIMSLKYVAGETTKPEEVMAVIQAEGKGFTLSISVTNEQAKKVQVGDVAELQNAWYYDDVMVTLASIRPDPDKAGTNKLLVFNVSGSTIQAGQSLSISVGQKSAEYELVVPNSAVREDNNGKFILTVESKSSPLGNRYIATRTNVEVLATDDNNTAISAPLYGYEYVITTSTKPVVAGKQVRLNE